jgi:hypothetical protein
MIDAGKTLSIPEQRIRLEASGRVMPCPGHLDRRRRKDAGRLVHRDP